MNIKLNTLNLNSGNYIVQELQIDEAPPISVSRLDFASLAGAKFVNSRFNPKTLRLLGRITGTTQQATEANIDNFKKTLLKDQNINLNFSYGAGFRQFIGNVAALSITREKYQVNYAIFDITFEASDPPFAYEVDNIDSVTPTIVELYSADNWVGNQRSGTFTATGTAQPLVRWRYVLDSVSGTIQQLVFKSNTTGKQMELNQAFSAGDAIEIDQENLIVTNRGIEIEYEGVFPEFNLGANEFQWNVYGVNTGLVLDQSQTTAYNLIGISNYEWGETFTCGIAGILGKVNLMFYSDDLNNNSNIRIRLYNTSGGLPTTVIQEVILDISNIIINRYTWYNIDFSSSLVSGTKYAISAYKPYGKISGYFGTSLCMASGNLYSGDIVWKSSSSWYINPFGTSPIYDLAFKTYIKTLSTSTFDHSSDIKLDQKKRFL